MKKPPNTAKLRLFAPVYAGWGKDRAVSDFRDKDFVDNHPLFSSREEAQQYANGNTGNYPYETTGEVVLVDVTVRPVK